MHTDTDTHSFNEQIDLAVQAIRSADHCIAFTGAGISVESGIPPFRGENGIWNNYDPQILEIDYFTRNPEESWQVIREIFYDFFGQARPNAAHSLLAKMEEAGLLKAVLTQNIDNLHHDAGSREVIEYHGNSRQLACTSCGKQYTAEAQLLRHLPPLCTCGGVLKPELVFFGEAIPYMALRKAEEHTEKSDCVLLIGTTGEVYPASLVPRTAAAHGATIIEINPSPSLYTDDITDIFIRSEAVRAAEAIMNRFFST